MNLREKIEQEITDKVMTKLASEKVELGLKQDAEKLNSMYFSTTDTVNSILKSLSNDARRADSAIDKALKTANEMKSMVAKLEKAAKDLGINVDNMPELKDMKTAIKDSTDYVSYKKTLKSII